MDARVRRVSMSVTKAASVLLFLTMSVTGSKCKETSNTQATKDPSDVVDVNLAEVDSSVLTPREKKDWSAAVSELLAPCADVPVSIAQCVQEKRPCKKCLPAAKFLVRQVRDGRARKQIDEAFYNRFDAAKVKNVEAGTSPSRGPADAPITIVEFADFECPVCGLMAPVLDKVQDIEKDKVRLVYKFMPLPMHTNGMPAARAGVAAMSQNKFWELHRVLYENQTRLSPPELEGYARHVGMDLAKYAADRDSRQTTERIDADRKQADALGVHGTPTLYINGREYDRSQDLLDWIRMDLALLGAGPTPAADAGRPSPAADAGKK